MGKRKSGKGRKVCPSGVAAEEGKLTNLEDGERESERERKETQKGKKREKIEKRDVCSLYCLPSVRLSSLSLKVSNLVNGSSSFHNVL